MRLRRCRTSLHCCARASSSWESTSPSGTSTGWSGSSRTSESLPFPDNSFDQALLVSTLEHVGADNARYGLSSEPDPNARVEALRELGRVLRPDGRLLVTVPLGEPGDHGWFRLDDVDGWNGQFAEAGLFVEEEEAYELTDDGWRAAPAFRAAGVGYGDRGPAASAVLCAELAPGRLRRLLTPDGLARTARRRLRPLRHG